MGRNGRKKRVKGRLRVIIMLSGFITTSSLSPNFPLIDIKKNVHQESHLGKLCVCLGFKAMDLRRMFG